jgi:hypothetical protein
VLRPALTDPVNPTIGTLALTALALLTRRGVHIN